MHGFVIIIVIYVDDLLLLGKEETIHEVCRRIREKFKCEPQQPLARFLGMRFTLVRNDKGRTLTIDQSDYIDTLLERAGLSDANPVNAPLDTGEYPTLFNPATDIDVSPAEHKNFRRDVGGLIFVASNTRFDVSLPVAILGRNVQRPARRHIQATKRVFRYLKGTRNVRLVWRAPPGPCTRLEWGAFGDADWAGEPSTRRSTTGQAHFLNGNMCHWNSKLQLPLTLSSTESETVALSATGRTARGLENLVCEVLQLGQLRIDVSVQLTGDNHASLFITEGTADLRKVRHLELSDLYSRILAARPGWSVRAIGTLLNAADLGTKILDAVRIRVLRQLCHLEQGSTVEA